MFELDFESKRKSLRLCLVVSSKCKAYKKSLCKSKEFPQTENKEKEIKSKKIKFYINFFHLNDYFPFYRL